MRYFIAPDVEHARALAMEHARLYGEPLPIAENVGSSTIRTLVSSSSGTIPVVRADRLSPRDRSVIAGLARSALAVPYGRAMVPEFDGMSVHVAGTQDPLAAYQALRGLGVSDGDAARAAKNFSGDVWAANDHMSLMRARARVLRCVDAIRAKNLADLTAECDRATFLDVNVVLRSIVMEYETSCVVSWSHVEIGPLLDNIGFIAQTLPKGFVKNPKAVMYAVMVGVYYAHQERKVA